MHEKKCRSRLFRWLSTAGLFIARSDLRQRQTEGQSSMRKPTIRVTKWLADIPVEAGGGACPDLVFRVTGSGHRRNRDEYQRSLQEQFDGHCRDMDFADTTAA
jgi:hypothetical protein